VSKIKRVLAIALALLLTAGVGGGAVWWTLRPAAAGARAENAAVDVQEYRYVNLEKVIVMLRGTAGEPMSHYLAVDLVFKAPLKTEKATKEHLPLLRSVSVMALSAYTLEKASAMTLDEFAAEISAAISARYAAEHGEKPFAEVMISRLIIE
jgi:flagellar FliL protein